MNVEQLIEALRTMPAKAVVLYEGDAGYSLVGGLNLQPNAHGSDDPLRIMKFINLIAPRAGK